MSFEKIEVSEQELLSQIGTMSDAEIDALPFGVIELDASGVILRYNQYEEQFAERKSGEVVGRNFFTEIAPCTRVQKFHGAFQAGIAKGQLNEVFDFTFQFRSGPRGVRIRMVQSDAPRPSIWIFVTPVTVI